MKPVYLYVTPFFPSPDSWRGGYCLDAVRALVRAGRFDVRTFVPGRGADYDYGGVRVCRFPFRVLPFGLLPFLTAHGNAAAFRRALAAHGLQPRDIAVCHVNAPVQMPLALALKRENPALKAVVQMHMGTPFDVRSGRLGHVPLHAELVHAHLRRLFARMDTAVFVSRRQRDRFGCAAPAAPGAPDTDLRRSLVFGRFLKKIPLPADSRIVYNAVDGDLFNAAGRLPHDGFVIGCVANFTRTKGQRVLIEAFARVRAAVPDARLRLVGSGDCLRICQRQVRDLRLADCVTFEPERPHDALPAFYRALDVFVMPSWEDSWNSAAAEAAACGTPVICSANIGFAEAFSAAERAACLAPPGDAAALADRLLAFHADPSRVPPPRLPEISCHPPGKTAILSPS